MDETKYYRCGMCGCPVDVNGNCLSPDEIKKWDGENAILMYGECCMYADRERERITVTKDMAIDAQDLSLEGETWLW